MSWLHWVVLVFAKHVTILKGDCYLGNYNGSLKQSPASTHTHKAVGQA